ncbi:unnamed protein product [Durusdinium trenchii]|uniref:C3H1-type domain-containing protein n=1 Tax=Durusdinium trenchii TaxID=1381693 RepID=A0ABP0I9S6_9DINO
MHGRPWPSRPLWFEDGYYEPGKGEYLPSSEQDVHALALAQQQLRLQSAELQRLRMEVRQLRQACDEGSAMNQYLMAQLETVKAQLRSAQQAAAGATQIFAAGAGDFHIPSPRAVPTPFHSDEGGSTSRFLPREIQVEDLPEDVPTIGSLGHPENCKPCFYMFNKKGCHFGRSCQYCHLEHVKRKKERPPKLVRQECREIANQVFRDLGASSSQTSNLEALRSRAELARASQVTANYAASVLRAMERRTSGAASSAEEPSASLPGQGATEEHETDVHSLQ